MARLVAPANELKELDVRTEAGKYRYKVKKDGSYHVENANHARQMREEGFIDASLMGVIPKPVGFPCKNCGFSSFFAKCSRCETVNERVEANE